MKTTTFAALGGSAAEPTTPRSNLLSPSEWAVLKAVYSLTGPATVTAVARGLPKTLELPEQTVEALLERLAGRQFLSPQPGGYWGPGKASLQELLQPQVAAFFEVYLAGVPQGVELVKRILETPPLRTSWG